MELYFVQLTKSLVAPRVFYRDDPLGGTLFNQALNGSYTLAAPEVTLRAVPFFFTLADVTAKRLSYNWQMNQSKVITDASDQQLATFAPPAEGSGANTITVSAENLASIFQTAKNNLKLSFGQANTNPF